MRDGRFGDARRTHQPLAPAHDRRHDGARKGLDQADDGHAAEFIRRFLLHVLPSGFHRIRHYGFLASPGRAANIGRRRELKAACDGTAQPSRAAGAGDAAIDPEPSDAQAASKACPSCGGRMRVIETFARGARPRSFTAEPAGIDSS